MTNMTELATNTTHAEDPADQVYGQAPDGTLITEADVQWSLENAESGYPGVTARPVGHPLLIADHPAVVVQFRIDRSKLRQLDQKARSKNLTRSELLRVAVDHELTSP